jgi:hypothetical protein
MTRFRRIAAVTAALVAAGASPGALAAVLGLAVMLGWVAIISRDPTPLLWGAAYGYLGAVGAALGAVGCTWRVCGGAPRWLEGAATCRAVRFVTS